MRPTAVSCTGPSSTEEPGGFTLLETVISISILGVIVTSFFTITLESMSLLDDTEADYAVQTEADRALSRIVAILHKTGRVKEKRAQYPRVTGGGAAVEFRLPDDLDGDGHPFDAETAALEWNPHVFSIKRDTNGTVSLYRSGAEIYTIANNVRFLRFETVAENPALHLKEVSIVLEIRKTRKTGHDEVCSLSGSAHIRN